MAVGQGNAADRRQVEAASRRQKDARRQELEDVKVVLSSRPGRRFVWRLLEQARIFASVMAADGVIQYQAGRQDFGHELMALLEQADGEALFTMMREAREERVKQERSRTAEQTPSAGGNDDAQDV